MGSKRQDYIIKVYYNFSNLVWEDCSRKIFVELAKRNLSFSASQSHVINDKEAVRVSINGIDYIPLAEGESRLMKKLDKLVSD